MYKLFGLNIVRGRSISHYHTNDADSFATIYVYPWVAPALRRLMGPRHPLLIEVPKDAWLGNIMTPFGMVKFVLRPKRFPRHFQRWQSRQEKRRLFEQQIERDYAQALKNRANVPQE